MSIFEQTTRPSEDVFYHRDDPNDIRLGETVKTDPADYAEANIVLLGFPQEDGVSRNKGRLGTKDAPDAIRRSLYKLVEIEGLTLFDLGNTRIQNTLENSHVWHQSIVKQVLHDGKTLVVLGGGNDTSYPDCAALAHVFSAIEGINIDAHFDVRADEVRNSGTPYRQLLEEGYLDPTHFHEVAYQPFANSPTYLRYLHEKGVNTYDLLRVYDLTLPRLFGGILAYAGSRPVFWGLDMDVVRAGDAPGVSAPNPAGLSGKEFCHIAQIAGKHPHSKIFEITEVNPTYDIDDRTSRLAAAAIWYFLHGRSR